MQAPRCCQARLCLVRQLLDDSDHRQNIPAMHLWTDHQMLDAFDVLEKRDFDRRAGGFQMFFAFRAIR